jgi:hypothetical protein
MLCAANGSKEPIVTDAAERSGGNKGRIGAIRCKREPSITRGWKPTFRPPQTGLGAALPQVCFEPKCIRGACYLASLSRETKLDIQTANLVLATVQARQFGRAGDCPQKD